MLYYSVFRLVNDDQSYSGLKLETPLDATNDHHFQAEYRSRASAS